MSVLNNFLLDWKILPIGFGVLFTVVIINLKIPILPVSGFIFILLSLLLWFVSMCVTFIGLHKLLQNKNPIPYSLFNYLFGPSKPASKAKISHKPNADSVKKLTFDIDKYFISKWYCSISKDDNFPEESKAFLEEVLTRLVEVQLQVNNKSLLHGILNIYLKHLKEFRRSLKRKEKYNVTIEELYRYSHVCSNSNSRKPKEYFIQQLTTNLLRHFINSELWNSLPCHILVSILSRKFISYLLNMLSNPDVLNFLILSSVISKDSEEKLELKKYGRISVGQFFDTVDSKKNVQTSDRECKKNGREIDKKKQEEKEHDEGDKEKKEIGLVNKITDTKVMEDVRQENLEVVLRTRRKMPVETDSSHHVEKSLKRIDPVKIYEPKSSSKTWRDSRDLACVSLGQDPLDALHLTSESEKSGFKTAFWESARKSKDIEQESPPTASQIFNEVMNITSMEGLKSSIKPFSEATERTLQDIKGLQEKTVHNALHKIGDFQDEAAGMVEGILDFGRAGFRKGLKLTGLQDNIENAKATTSKTTKSVKDQVRKKLEELKKSDSDSQEKMSSAESADSVWINPLQIDSPNYDGHILLEKSPKKAETDLTRPPRIESLPIPSISTEQPSTETDSPDPEYEDTADLASSIAKLRSLLQQRSSESSLSTPALSPMPDEFLQKQTESENASDVEALEVDGVMPSFYKFCTKTASGVLSNTINTIKTALPGNNAEQVYTIEKWKFKPEQKESDILVRMKKLLTERKEYCILDKEIDTAYDALDSVDFFQQSPVLISSLQFDDELDDFEGKIPVTKVIFDIFCELLSDTSSPLIQEPLVKAVLLTFGNAIEIKTESEIVKTLDYLTNHLVQIPEKSNIDVLSLEFDEYIDHILNSSPDLLKIVLGKDNVKSALKLFVSSLQNQKINEDVFLQIFELVAMKLIEESTQISPPASA